MKHHHNPPLAVQLADEVLGMYCELVRLREENEELRQYRKKYIELLDADIAHGHHTMRNLLELTRTPGVLSALAEADKKTPT